MTGDLFHVILYIIYRNNQCFDRYWRWNNYADEILQEIFRIVLLFVALYMIFKK